MFPTQVAGKDEDGEVLYYAARPWRSSWGVMWGMLSAFGSLLSLVNILQVTTGETLSSVPLTPTPWRPPRRVPPFVLITTPDDTTSPPCLSRPRPPWMPQVRLWLVMQGTHFNGGIAKISIYMGYFSVWCQFQALVSHCNKLE